MEKQPAVYMLASRPYGALYVGVTSALRQRIWQHRAGVVEGFTKTYHIRRLVYFEMHGNMESAILREKRLKKWRREWKIELIEENNPEWKDLWTAIQ